MPLPRRFAISDIHGCLTSFRALLDRLEFSPSDQLFLLGDFIDRGPQSKGVIDYVWQLQAQGIEVQCLRGNHEQLLLDSLTTPLDRVIWLNNGGSETLEDFGVATSADIPDRYRKWMQDLPVHLATPGYLLVHAGLNFRRSDPLADEGAMLWLRHWYGRIDRDWLGDRIVVHGHTPTPLSKIKQRIARLPELPAINIDAGCVFDRPGMGHLCALELMTHELYFQPNVDR